jgi:uncharacterized protein (DUF1800 family)
VVQLFSIGLLKLHTNGTIQLDENGNEMRTYTNKDITEYAKVYTGFRRRETRGNIEEPDEWANNQVDPMSISPERKDHFPKVSRKIHIYPGSVDQSWNSPLTLL